MSDFFNQSSENELSNADQFNNLNSATHERFETFTQMVSETEEQSENEIPLTQVETSFYTPLLILSYDVKCAQETMDKILEEYMKGQFLLKTLPTSEFSVEGLSMLNTTFNKLLLTDKKCIFNTLEKLKVSMEDALGSCMHCEIFSRIVHHNLFWPNIATKIGLNALLPLNPLNTGTSGYWRISNQNLRKPAALLLNKATDEYKHALDAILVDVLKDDANHNYRAFLNLFKSRFRDTADKDGWIAAATQLTIAEMRSANHSTNDIEIFLIEFTDSIKAMIDFFCELLIVFALPLAKLSNRHLLRDMFALDDYGVMVIEVPLFNITLPVFKAEVPHPTGQHTVPNTSTVVKPPAIGNQSSATKLPDPKQALATPNADVTSINTPIPRRQVVTSTPITQQEVLANTAVKKAPGSNGKTISKAITTTTTNISASPKPNNGRRKDPSTVCFFDAKGCVKLGCLNLHIVTPTLLCATSKYKCIRSVGGTCLMSHENTSNSSTQSSKKRKSNPQVNIPLSPPPLSSNTTPITYPIGRKRRRRRAKQTAADTRINLLRNICHGVVNVGVHVLHDCVISMEERLVLSLGLNFVPPPHKRKSILLSESMALFTRRIRIKKHFAIQQDIDIPNNSIETLLHTRINKTLTLQEAEASFSPLVTNSPIESYLTKTTAKVLAEGMREIPLSYATKKQWLTFYDVSTKLRARKDIIIYPADKNLGVTVMNRNWYTSEASGPNYLGNSSTYTKIEKSPQIHSIISELSNICTEQTWLTQYKATKLYRDLISDHTRNKVKLCRMYFLPKLHKPTLALRPICSSINWITYWTSVYIHLQLFPLLKMIPSYITNSAQLVSLLDRINPPKYFQFIEADVDNLYPTIDIDDGLDAMYNFLSSRSRFPKAQIEFIIRLTRWVLKNNYVTFGQSTYLQISGTAMGTPCAVVVACIYMHIIEQEALDIFASQRYIVRSIFLFIRFIDDILALVSDHDTGLFLMELLNSRRNTTKLTFKIRNLEAQFLDLTLYKTKEHTLAVRAYSKPMNKFLFLPPTSCHPPHIFKGWIVGYGRRLRLNCSDDHEYTNNLNDFKFRLNQRGYPDNLIKEALCAIPDRQTIITSIRNQSPHNNTSIGVPFVVTYTPTIKDCIPLLKQALTYTEVAHLDPHFPQIAGTTTTPLLSFKRGKSLRELVTSSTLN